MRKEKKIKELIEKNRVGLFVTQTNGKLVSRPIALADVDENSNVWFFTDITTDKIDEIRENKNVNFSFANHSDNSYLSVSGVATIVDDQQEIDKKWNELNKVWFPEGKASKRLVLVKVSPETVEYWDGTSSKIMQAIQIGKAYVTGKSFSEVADAENEIVEFN